MFPNVLRTGRALVTLGFLFAAPLAAQPAPASAALSAMAGAGAAHAGLVGASGLNPALLAMPGAPHVSVQLPTLDAGFSFDPIGLTAIGKYEGSLIPADVRADWLARIRDAGAQRAGLATSLRALSVQWGSFAWSAGTTVSARANLPPEAAQLLFFGNAGRTGALEDVAVHGGSARGWAASSIGLSHAVQLPVSPAGGLLTLGATASYVMGHALADVGAVDAVISASGGSVSGHGTALTWGDSVAANSSGFGLDLGLAWTKQRLTLGVTMQNVVNTLRFDASNAFAREADVRATSDSSASNSHDGMLYVAGAPNGNFSAATRARADVVVASARFKPATRFAARFAVTSFWDVLADAVLQADPSAALVAGPRRTFSLGTNLRVFSALALHGGIGSTNDEAGSHAAFAGGLGLRLGAFVLDGGVTKQTGNGPDAMRVAVGTSLVFGGR
jgi:hypothetical protein